MAVFRINKSKDYTVMSNYHLKDKNISLKAIGLLSIMLSLPEGWDFSVAGLTAIVKDGKDSVVSTLQELEKARYLTRTQTKENGAFGSIIYDIYESPYAGNPYAGNPYAGNPYAGNPYAGNPYAGNPPQLNTNISNTKEENTKEVKSSSARAREEMKSGTDNAVQAFLSTYPQVVIDTITADLSAVDFSKVAEAFKKSGYLRANAKSLAWICENHGKIESGFYADREKTDKTEKPLPKSVRDANARAERERWYAKRRAEAEAIADKNRAKAERNANYVQTARELSDLEREWAKAGAFGLPTEEALRLRMISKMDERDGRLRMMGLTADDLNPKWKCEKCEDTGFEKSGKPCGCYEE